MIKFPMRKLVFSLTAIFIVSIVITGVLVLTQILPNGRLQSGSGQVYTEQWDIPFESGKNLSIDLTNVDVVIDTYEGNTVKASFEGYRASGKEAILPSITQKDANNTISFQQKSKPTNSAWFAISFDLLTSISGTLTLSIPDDPCGNVYINNLSGNQRIENVKANNILLDSSSGDITAKQLDAKEKISLTTFSGHISAENTTSDTLHFTASSGNIDIASLRASNLSCETFSGSITGKSITIEQLLFASTSSGDISLSDATTDQIQTDTFSGETTMDTTLANSIRSDSSSGRIHATLLQAADINFTTFSGDAKVYMPADAQFSCLLDTMSGKISVGYAATQSSNSKSSHNATVGNGLHKIDIETSSGNITIDPTN